MIEKYEIYLYQQYSHRNSTYAQLGDGFGGLVSLKILKYPQILELIGVYKYIIVHET